jgi:hypothetical protein
MIPTFERERSELLRAWPITTARQACNRLLPMLQQILSSKHELETHRYFLKSLRDDLDDYCRRYRRDSGQAVEDYGPVYEPLFDALSLVNDTLVCRPLYRVTLQRAFDELSRLQTKLDSGAI